MTLLIAAIVGVIAIVLLVVQGNKVYPPMTVQRDHLEAWPRQQIMTEPIDLRIQGHVMEHASHQAATRAGVIVSYNCDRLRCTGDTIDRLVSLVTSYPDGVYLAPFPRMSSPLALTTRDKRDILESVDEQRIRQFIADAGWMPR